MISALSLSQHASHTLYNAPSCSYSRIPPLPSSANLPSSQEKSSDYFSSSDATPMHSRPYVSSPCQVFRVYGYGPQEGAPGVCIAVNLQFHLVSSETTFLRIVVGNRALATDVQPVPGKREGEWNLRAVIPEPEGASTGFPHTVPVTVQALSGSNDTIDSLTFGRFTYIHRYGSSGSPLLMCKQETTEDPALNLRELTTSSSSSSAAGRSRSRPNSAGAARNRQVKSAGTRDSGGRSQLKKQSLIRARRSNTDDDDADSAFRASLILETPTDPLANVQDWDPEERRIGRRLVRFSRVQEGCTLRVACEPILPSAYTEGETVVSCIFRPPEWAGAGDPPVSQCCITSVDIIFLLECLVGDVFNIEERNRIRRNVEGYRPKTVSKNKPGSEEFFQKIMDFPAPKPRNIEKDVKVFDWAVLPQALDKIISKYTFLPAVLKQDGGEPKRLSTRSTPQVPQAPAPASYPAPLSPDLKPSESGYMPYHYPSYRTSYPTSLDGLENTPVSAVVLPVPDVYDAYISHSHSPSPTPLLSTPADSPLGSQMMSLNSYPDANPALYPQGAAYGDHNAYSMPFMSASYDNGGFRRSKLSDTTHAYL